MKEERLHTILELIGWVAVLITVICILNSCGPCSKCPIVGQRDSIYVERVDSVFLRDTVIMVQMRDSTTSNVVADTEKSHLETDLATSDAWMEDGKLHHSLSNKTDLTPIPVQIPNYVSSEKIHLTRTIIKEVEKDLKWYQQTLMYMGIVLLIIILIKLLWRRNLG